MTESVTIESTDSESTSSIPKIAEVAIIITATILALLSSIVGVAVLWAWLYMAAVWLEPGNSIPVEFNAANGGFWELMLNLGAIAIPLFGVFLIYWSLSRTVRGIIHAVKTIRHKEVQDVTPSE